MTNFYTFKADALAPEATKTIDYSGPNPSRVISLIPEIIKESLRITSTPFFEDSFKWDVSEDPVDFYAIWRGKDKKDNHTAAWVKIRVQGSESAKDKVGTVKIWITGVVKIKIPYDNAFQKAMAITYMRLFYYSQMRRYIDETKKKVELIENSIRQSLGLISRSSRWE